MAEAFEGVVKVPGAEEATADSRKFTHYLLSETHEKGKAKAKFFREVAGYDESNWEQLRDEFLAQLPDADATLSKTNPPWGDCYEVPMTIEAPNGTIEVLTIWEVHPITGTTLVTAYPL